MLSRIETLQKKLKAREGQSGFEKNCEMIRQEIERLTTVADVAASAGTSQSKQDAPSVASTVKKDQSGE
jgi:hypothetical protein